MANPLTHAQKADMHGDEASVFDSLAKAKRSDAKAAKQALTAQSTETDRLAVIALYDKALYYCQMSESHAQQQADEAAQPDP